MRGCSFYNLCRRDLHLSRQTRVYFYLIYDDFSLLPVTYPLPLTQRHAFYCGFVQLSKFRFLSRILFLAEPPGRFSKTALNHYFLYRLGSKTLFGVKISLLPVTDIHIFIPIGLQNINFLNHVSFCYKDQVQ